jgi:predicted Zn-dependent protease with MMP-like domain
MDINEFEEILDAALLELPELFKRHIDNVEVEAVDEPSRKQLEELKVSGLYGLYQGVPLTYRNQGYSMVLPDKIEIYRLPILRSFRTRSEIIRQIKRTLIHEIGHHFGLNEEEIRMAMGD